MKTIELNITGMHCDNCTARITECLQKQDGVREAEVDLMTRTATVTVDDNCGIKSLTHAIEEIGFQVDGFRPVTA